MKKLRPVAVVVGALALAAVTAPAAVAGPPLAPGRTAPPLPPFMLAAAAERPLWAPGYLSGEVSTWPCASSATRTCGVWSSSAGQHFRVTFTAGGEVESVTARRASTQDQ